MVVWMVGRWEMFWVLEVGFLRVLVELVTVLLGRYCGSHERLFGVFLGASTMLLSGFWGVVDFGRRLGLGLFYFVL
jgi:hypothetical protein